jgi:hypothetical protein
MNNYPDDPIVQPEDGNDGKPPVEDPAHPPVKP